MTNSKTKSRATLIAITVLFLAPVVAAIFLNSQWSDWQPEASRNHGELVKPVVAMNELNSSATVVFESQSWKLLTAPGQCGPDCLDLLTTLARVKAATGRHQDNLELVFAPATTVAKQPELTEFTVVENSDLNRLLSEQGLQNVAHNVYLIDPRGFLMMQYTSGFDPTGLRKDLDRLLKYSKFE